MTKQPELVFETCTKHYKHLLVCQVSWQKKHGAILCERVYKHFVGSLLLKTWPCFDRRGNRTKAVNISLWHMCMWAAYSTETILRYNEFGTILGRFFTASFWCSWWWSWSKWATSRTKRGPWMWLSRGWTACYRSFSTRWLKKSLKDNISGA